ncbi:hypothetical protein RZS08_22300, partial [Arthrospira platensis SPKY1]|nr:hypothetical protein [Arthrospira platensis SPKY1]
YFSWFNKEHQFPNRWPVELLQTTVPKIEAGLVVNYREWSGIIQWASRGRLQTLIDGRLYLFDREDWLLYDQIALGQLSVDKLEEVFSPVAFIVHCQYHAALIELLELSPRWQRVTRDNCSSASQSAIFLPVDLQTSPPN